VPDERTSLASLPEAFFSSRMRVIFAGFPAHMKRSFRAYCAIAGCLLLCPCFAQKLSYTHYNTSNSQLPHDVVYHLLQDSNGFLWVSTDDGLVRFDGLEMKSYEKGLVSRYVIGTDEENGGLWVATWRGGIQRMEGDSMAMLRTLPDGESAYYTGRVIVYDSLVIAFKNDTEYRTYRWDPSAETLTETALQGDAPAGSPFRFLKTRGHILYAYNSTGIYRVSGQKLLPVNTELQPDEIWESPSGKLFLRMGAVIYRVSADLSVWKPYSRIPSQFSPDDIFFFCILPSGNICVGTWKKGEYGSVRCFLADARTGEITDLLEEMHTDAPIADILADREGGIWISTDGSGLYHVFDSPFAVLSGEGNFRNRSVTALQAIGSTLYIGTKKGVYRYSGKQLQPVQLPNSEFYHAKNFFFTPDGRLAVVSRTSSSESYTVEGAPEHLPYTETNVTAHYTLVRNQGLYDRHQRKMYISTDPGLIQDGVTEDISGRLWMGGVEGLYYFTPRDGLRQFVRGGIGSFQVKCLAYEPQKGLWAGTSRGLFLIVSAHDVRRWGTEEGLGNVNIMCMHIQSPNSLWIGTQNGLFHFRNGRFSVYRKRSGLIADDVTSLAELPGNMLAVGSSKGISFVPMDTLVPPDQPPALLVEEITVNGHQAYDHGSDVHLPYNSTIGIRYNAVTFIYSELLAFEYRLRDDQPWIRTQSRYLVFTHLRPGNYHLQVRVKNYGSGFSAPSVFHFTIRAPWWKSRYMSMGLILLALILPYLLFSYRLGRQRIRRELSELKLKALQAQLNPHFVSNTLNAIQYFLLIKDDLRANDYLTRFADLTRLLLDTSRKRFISLRTEIRILTLYLSLERLRFGDRFGYSIEVDPSLDINAAMIPGMLVQPFAENSINHGMMHLGKDAEGILRISMKLRGQGVEITVDDNGVGRARSAAIRSEAGRAHQSRSTQIVKEICASVSQIPGCRIDIQIMDKHAPETGTRVVIFVHIPARYSDGQL